MVSLIMDEMMVVTSGALVVRDGADVVSAVTGPTMTSPSPDPPLPSLSCQGSGYKDQSWNENDHHVDRVNGRGNYCC